MFEIDTHLGKIKKVIIPKLTELLADEWFLPMSAKDLMRGNLAMVAILDDMLLLFVSLLLLLSYWK